MQGSTIRRELACVGFGQLIMFLNVLTNIFSQYLTNDGASLPTLQTAFLYVALAVVCLPVKYLVRRKRELGVSLWYYVFLAIVDVEGNYFAVKAFAYANFVTVGLLLNLTVPFATAFCYVFLKTRYTVLHYIGSAVALCGCVVIFATDYHASDNQGTGHEIRGDIYCVISAALYASSNIMVQNVVKIRGMDANIELLGFMGLFATVLSAVQIWALELGPIKQVTFTSTIYALIAAYAIAMFFFYMIVSVFLRRAESVLFNLSLLTGPVFTVFASYFLFHQPVKGWYWFALVLFYIGLVLYSLNGEPEEHKLKRLESPAIEMAAASPSQAEDGHAKCAYQSVA